MKINYYQSKIEEFQMNDIAGIINTDNICGLEIDEKPFFREHTQELEHRWCLVAILPKQEVLMAIFDDFDSANKQLDYIWTAECSNKKLYVINH